MIEATTRDVARFWSKVDKSGDCWLWIAGKDSKGYGIFSQRSKAVAAHRFAYRLEYGPIPDGMMVDHKCHASDCVRPTHLRAATRKQNGENRKGAQRNSKSGVRGVCWYKGKWFTGVKHEGKSYYVGSYDDIADAEAAVVAKRNELFSHNQEKA